MSRPSALWSFLATYALLYGAFGMQSPFVPSLLRERGLRWTQKFGQEIKLGLLLRRTDLNDGQTEAVFGGFQGEGCS